MKTALAFVFLTLLSSQLAAYALQVKVTVSQDTLAECTNVSLITGGIALAEGRAGGQACGGGRPGIIQFNVSAGSYFVLLSRGGYPSHVNLIRVENDTSVTYTLSPQLSYASAYGQITGPQDFSNATIVAYSGGAAAKKATANPDGFYVLSFLSGGSYELKFSSIGFEPQGVQVFLPTSEFVQVNAQLKKPQAQQEEQPPSLSAPPAAQQFSLIEVYLSSGGSPLAGRSISVETPSGTVSVATGADGIARINAAEAGTYRFSYGNASASTTVAAKEAARPPETEKNETPEVTGPQQEEQPAAPPLSLFAVVLFIGAGLAFVAVAVLAAWWLLGRGGKEKPPGHPHHRHHRGK